MWTGFFGLQLGSKWLDLVNEVTKVQVHERMNWFGQLSDHKHLKITLLHGISTSAERNSVTTVVFGLFSFWTFPAYVILNNIWKWSCFHPQKTRLGGSTRLMQPRLHVRFPLRSRLTVSLLESVPCHETNNYQRFEATCFLFLLDQNLRYTKEIL